jgi:hypothetical protein
VLVEEEETALKKAVVAGSAAKAAVSDVEDQDVSEVVESATKKPEAAKVTLEDMPDDPDEAMAWMGALGEDEEVVQGQAAAEVAAAQGIQEEKEKNEGGSVLKKGVAAVSAAQLAKSFIGDSENDDGESEQETTGEVAEQEILDGMPDDPDEAMAWMAGLAAHDALTDENVPKREAEEGSDQSPEAALTGEAAKTVEAQSVADSTVLSQAQDALSSGDVAGATQRYRMILESGEGRTELIAALESVVGDGGQEPEILQVLGDAYMEDGQMQKALEVFSRGFDQS